MYEKYSYCTLLHYFMFNKVHSNTFTKIHSNVLSRSLTTLVEFEVLYPLQYSKLIAMYSLDHLQLNYNYSTTLTTSIEIDSTLIINSISEVQLAIKESKFF